MSKDKEEQHKDFCATVLPNKVIEPVLFLTVILLNLYVKTCQPHLHSSN